MIPDENASGRSRHSESMVMHNKSNDTITQVAITDVPQYLRDILESPHNYALRLYITDTQEQASLAIVKTYSNEPVRMLLTPEDAAQLWSYITESRRDLKDRYDVLIDIREASIHESQSLSVTKNTRMSVESLISDKSITREAYDFLKTAYRAGINIIIEGATGSGRTRFLNTLMDSARDYKPTLLVNSFPEMFFGFNRSELTEIRSENPSQLLSQLLSMNQPRMILDDTPIDYTLMPEVVKKANSGIQFVATGYRSVSTVPGSNNDFLASVYVEHPFELRVHVKTVWNCYEKRSEFTVLSVEQIIQQKVGKLITSRNRLLFSNFGKVAEPTRILRRKMEAYAQQINTINSSVSQLTVTPEAPATLVAITAEQKEQLAEHLAALAEHLKNQSPALRGKFEEIEKILAKF
jgi:hypothetical protein